MIIIKCGWLPMAFITATHTLKNFRDELLVPDLINSGNRRAWEAAGSPNLHTRAREKTRRILTEYCPLPLLAGVTAQLDEIVKVAETRIKQGENST